MTGVPRAGSIAAALLTLLIAACGAAHKGDVAPGAVSAQAHALVRQTLAALRPTIGTPATAPYRDTWTRCGAEAPGQHRFRYVYGVVLTLPRARAQTLVAAADALFTARGYTLNYSDAPTLRTTATLPHSSFVLGVGVRSATTTVLEFNAPCVPTRPDPA
ncbi:hypothetical protein [Streptomyces sp. CA2R106]|uniref:hypothetical protein n=1 Tax=Streptomyces sp. CA2R106 TaxID=3120153 RepID=UPI0030091A99